MYANMKREERDARAVIGSDPKGVFTTEAPRHREKQKLSPQIDADQRGYLRFFRECLATVWATEAFSGFFDSGVRPFGRLRAGPRSE